MVQTFYLDEGRSRYIFPLHGIRCVCLKPPGEGIYQNPPDKQQIVISYTGQHEPFVRTISVADGQRIERDLLGRDPAPPVTNERSRVIDLSEEPR